MAVLHILNMMGEVSCSALLPMSPDATFQYYIIRHFLIIIIRPLGVVLTCHFTWLAWHRALNVKNAS